MSDDRVTRREFVRDGATAAAGIAVGLGAVDALAADAAAQTQPAVRQPAADKSKILNYNEKMEYRRLGKTGLMISAISLGGHWKQLPYRPGTEEFKKNRHDVISACIDCGINYVDACTGQEVVAYAEALRGRRDRMYLGYSWYEHEMRFKEWQNIEALMKGFDEGLHDNKLDYVDIWRITCYEPGGNHTPAHEEVIIEALTRAKKAGKARFGGISSHDRKWLKHMIETRPEIDVVLTPYHADSKKKPEDSLFDALKKNNVGLFGIKPFASGSVFQSRGAIRAETEKVDSERARLALRHVLCNDAITAPIPGLISVEQVKNAALAVTERRELDMADIRRLERAVSDMWANLPEEYRWLRDWEWV